MEGRIKVTGYLNVEDLPVEFIDINSSTGLSEDGYQAILGVSQIQGLEHEGNLRIGDLDDVNFEFDED